MTPLQTISNSLKEAMKAKDSVRLQVLRSIKGELLKLQTSGKDNQINEESLLKIVKSLIKEKNESIDFASQANRQDMIDAEKKTLVILETFLPEQFSESEIDQLVNQAIEQAQATSPQDIGKAMGQIRQILTKSPKDANMNIISQLVKNKLKN